jgi:hypothetical protein
MAFIHLLRCKAEPRAQLDAFTGKLSPTEIVTKSFLTRPTAKVPRGAVWHIGNTEQQSDGTVSFALGREAIVKAQEYDTVRREFREIEQSQAPFTVGVYDPNSQTAGVLIRGGVSLGVREVATKLQILLEAAGVARDNNSEIVVDFIPDPSGFIEILRQAHRITRYEFEFSPPNPPDDNKYVKEPLKKFAQRVGAIEGKTSVKGPDLDKDELVSLTKEIAASGDDASANVQMEAGGQVERRHLQTDPLREQVEPGENEATSDAIKRAMKKGFDGIKEAHG